MRIGRSTILLPLFQLLKLRALSHSLDIDATGVATYNFTPAAPCPPWRLYSASSALKAPTARCDGPMCGGGASSLGQQAGDDCFGVEPRRVEELDTRVLIRS